MGRRVRKGGPAAEAARPVAVMPEQLQVYDPADWLPPGVAEPSDGNDDAAWEAFDDAHRRGYQAFLAAGVEWHANHQLPPLNIAELPPDEPYTPPANKVDGRVMGAAASEPQLLPGEGPRGTARADGLAGRDARYRRRRRRDG